MADSFFLPANGVWVGLARKRQMAGHPTSTSARIYVGKFDFGDVYIISGLQEVTASKGKKDFDGGKMYIILTTPCTFFQLFAMNRKGAMIQGFVKIIYTCEYILNYCGK